MTRSDGIFEKLEAYCPGVLPMHMPGHKRNTGLAPYLERLGADIDITEIDGFDNLHDASGIIKEAMERAARLWGAKRSFFSVNGSTGGVLAAIFAAVEDGSEVICARNCHKSVYNALRLRRAKVRFIYPERESFTGTDCIVTPEAVAAALEKHPTARAVIVTSPSYEGVICDIAGIAAAAHDSGALLIADEAHGAHLGFGHGFPSGAVASGADIVIQSLHKTLPSLTQTAVVHIQGDRADAERLARSLSDFETSSPSYLLMASIDSCVRLIEREGEKLFSVWQKALRTFYDNTATTKLEIMKKTPEMFALDPSKIVISTRKANLTGAELASRLREKYKIETEMAAADHVIAMSGMGDSEASLMRLSRAIVELDGEAAEGERAELFKLPAPKVFCQSHEVGDIERVPIESAVGRVCGEYVWAYPPGIPLIIPGEVISGELIDYISESFAAGIELKSSFGGIKEKIYVMKKA